MMRWGGFVSVVCALLLLTGQADARKKSRVKKVEISPIAEAAAAIKSGAAVPVSAAKPGDEVSMKLIDLEVSYWEPGAVGPRPLILFSHGYGGCNTQSRFLTKQLALKGWLVMAPNHSDAKCKKARNSEEALDAAAGWSTISYFKRQAEMRALFQQLKYEPQWRTRIDWSRVGLMGYGLGGYTSLAMVGGMDGWKVDGIAGVLAASPACAPLLQKGKLNEVGVPVMLQGGNGDDDNSAFLRQADGCFDKMGGNAAYVEFEKAGHNSWTDRGSIGHVVMADYAGSFFDAVFTGAPLTFKQKRGVAELRLK